MRKANIVTSIFLIGAGLAMVFIVIPWQTSPGEKYGVPPATVPTAAMTVVTVMAVILLIQSLRDSAQKQPARKSPMSLRHWLHIGGYTAFLFAGLAALKWLHFIPGGILLLAVLMVLCGQRKPLLIALVAVPLPFFIYAALWYGLRMPLP